MSDFEDSEDSEDFEWDEDSEDMGMSVGLVDESIFGNIGGVRTLLDQGANIDYIWLIQDATALMGAALYEYNDVAELLLERGANPNIQNNDGFTAIMFASINDDNTEMIELLLSYGADLHIRNNSGETALTVAINEGNQDNVMTLIRHENIIKTQRLTRRRNTRRRIKTIKNKKMLSFAKTQDRLHDFIGQDMDPQIYSNISNHVSNMKYDRLMPRMIERIDPYNEWLQDMRSD